MTRQLSEAQRRVLASNRFRPGESGCPGGATQEQRLYLEIVSGVGGEIDPDTGISRRELAARIFWSAIEDGQQWAIKEMHARDWPVKVDLNVTGALDVSVSDGFDQLLSALDRLETPAAPETPLGTAHVNGYGRVTGGSQ